MDDFSNSSKLVGSELESMSRTTVTIFWGALCLVSLWDSTCGAETKARVLSKSRAFRFDYAATVNRLPTNSQVRIWLPVPQSNEHQHVKILNSTLPKNSQTYVEPTYGNKIAYFQTAIPDSGNLSFKTSYHVVRQEVRGLANGNDRVELSAEQRNRFLSANMKVPLSGKQLRLLKDVTLSDEPMTLARALYNRVDDHVRYDKSRPGYGNGDVLWVCNSRYGNCTDFHSLFISLARAKGLPARFEIGFPLPPKYGTGKVSGYHCWALFHTDAKGWVPVDISEADKHPEMKEYYFGSLTEHRVTFTTGRDIELVPRQAGEPLNFFIYPYVEVDSKPLSKEKIKLAFTYTDESQ